MKSKSTETNEVEAKDNSQKVYLEKELVPVFDNRSCLYTIKFKQGGGQVPSELSGSYTSETIAHKAISSFIQKKITERK